MTVCASIFFTPGIFERLTPIEIRCIGQLNKVANDMYHNITVDQWLYLYLEWCKRRIPVTIHDDEYWMGIYRKRWLREIPRYIFKSDAKMRHYCLAIAGYATNKKYIKMYTQHFGIVSNFKNWIQLNLTDTRDVIQVVYNYLGVVLLRSDGTVKTFGRLVCPRDNKDIIKITTSNHYRLVGLRRDGSIIIWSSDFYYEYPSKNYVDIDSKGVCILGLRRNGSIFIFDNGTTKMRRLEPHVRYKQILAGAGVHVGLTHNNKIRIFYNYGKSILAKNISDVHYLICVTRNIHIKCATKSDILQIIYSSNNAFTIIGKYSRRVVRDCISHGESSLMSFLNQDGVISTDRGALIYDAIKNNNNFVKLIKRNDHFGDMIGVKLDGSVVLIKSSIRN